MESRCALPSPACFPLPRVPSPALRAFPCPACPPLPCVPSLALGGSVVHTFRVVSPAAQSRQVSRGVCSKVPPIWVDMGPQQGRSLRENSQTSCHRLTAAASAADAISMSSAEGCCLGRLVGCDTHSLPGLVALVGLCEDLQGSADVIEAGGLADKACDRSVESEKKLFP